MNETSNVTRSNASLHGVPSRGADENTEPGPRSSHYTEISKSYESTLDIKADDRDFQGSNERSAPKITSVEFDASGTRDLARIPTRRSVITNVTRDHGFDVDFEGDGSDNPKEWSIGYKSLVIFFVSFSTAMVVMYSTAFASGIPGMMQAFDVENKTVLVLGITTYLIGLAAGSVILAPMSEMFGRRLIYIISMSLFTLLVLPCALATNLETVLVTRFFAAVAGSAMISNAPGTVADIVTDEYRALAFSAWSIGPMNGPVLGPVVGGFVVQYLGWRWTNWVVMIGSGVALALLISIPETYAPTLLRTKAAKRRLETSNNLWRSRYDERTAFWPLLQVNLSRPFTMALTEPICIFWNIYVGIIYAMLYLCFVAYPIVFSEKRGWTPSQTGLSYVGIAVGTLLAIASEPLLRRMINSQRPDPSSPAESGNEPPPEAMVLVVCIASILIPTGALIFAWTSPPSIHYIFPILAGIPFGMGNTLCFIYASNYLVHSYGIYSASALAGNAVLRSVLGGCLPLAGPALHASLGSRWAGTLLAGLEILCIPIPWVFWRYGRGIREGSGLIRTMRVDQEMLEAKVKRGEKIAVV